MLNSLSSYRLFVGHSKRSDFHYLPMQTWKTAAEAPEAADEFCRSLSLSRQGIELILTPITIDLTSLSFSKTDKLTCPIVDREYHSI
jgi:hypothetical protein